MPELEPERRKDGLEEVETGFSAEQARQEAERCLSCRRCLGCGLCLAVCEPKAIVFEQEDEVLDLVVDEIILSPEAGQYMPYAQGELGYGTCRNVVSAFEFERILEKDGPFGGLVLRPFDGEIPQKIAFIVVTGRDGNVPEEDGTALVSYTLRQASLALKKLEDLRISVLVSRKGDPGTLFSEAVEEEIHVRAGEVLEVEEGEDTKNLHVTFTEKGEKKEEEFEMLVLSKVPETRPELRALHEKLGSGKGSR